MDNKEHQDKFKEESFDTRLIKCRKLRTKAQRIAKSMEIRVFSYNIGNR